MTRALVVAGDPVGRSMAGPGARSLETAKALTRHGLQVTLAVAGEPEPGLGVPAIGYGTDGLGLAVAADGADALVVGGLTLVQMPFLARLGLPIAVDLYAPFVLENVVAARSAGSAAARRADTHADDVRAVMAQLGRGDYFMAASEVQRDFWLGMLTAAGRVSPATVRDDPGLRRLIGVVPFGVPDAPPVPRPSPALPGVWPGLGPNDRVIVWAGGLWDWLDPLTLIRAVATLARSRPNVRLLFMGGRTPSPHVGEMGVAAAAEALARRHDPDGRTVLFNRGWVPYEERGALLLEADIGASLHHRTVESRYAFRTRILDYIWAGLPMVVSGGDALGDQVGRLGLGYTVPEGDPDSVAAALAELLDDEGARSSRAERFAVARAEMAWSRAVEPLVEFLRRGEPAADRPAAGVAFRPTPVWGLPGRALRALRAGGARGLARETERYLAWRRRPR